MKNLQNIDLTKNNLTDNGKDAVKLFLIGNMIRNQLSEDRKVLDLSPVL